MPHTMCDVQCALRSRANRQVMSGVTSYRECGIIQRRGEDLAHDHLLDLCLLHTQHHLPSRVLTTILLARSVYPAEIHLLVLELHTVPLSGAFFYTATTSRKVWHRNGFSVCQHLRPLFCAGKGLSQPRPACEPATAVCQCPSACQEPKHVCCGSICLARSAQPPHCRSRGCTLAGCKW
ncbi:hypothetical protein BDZ85DRAFT_61729 [Elsinoe ampelina]|uniref:Uncharacterized protein n=1 Tax=Elsinoe ampelina TaxID=302913 RepID=A0A6A6G027_9PEZI|nr:hypothetical protein BDZ85DRAFT_61729 [Elsinoe ampelina]